ncbi:MAG: hypothetical protein M0R40_08225 [Firmicutes bacterium]|nr:hypothetical protein [Bacillota bacterium]
MADNTRLGNIFEKNFVSFDIQGKKKKIIFNGTKRVDDSGYPKHIVISHYLSYYNEFFHCISPASL